MPPHSPPCGSNEILYGDLCYPQPNVQVLRQGNEYSFVLDSVSPGLLPWLSDRSGQATHMLVKKSGADVDVTITTSEQADAENLLKRLRPNDSDLKLPE